MKLVDALNSETAIALGFSISRLVPPSIGYPLARRIADWVSNRRDSLMVRAVRANQWVVHNGEISSAQLDRLVVETFRNSARSLYEFWRYFRDPQAVMNMIEFDPSFQERFNAAKSSKTGTLMVAAHMSNFDLIGRALALKGLDIQILSYPQPPGGYRWQNRLREAPGLLVTPMSIQALRQASQTLRENHTVLTGVDRPLPEGEDAKYRPHFFGRAAAMPVFYIRLALKHRVPITVLGACRTHTGRYRVWASEPIQLQPAADLLQETVQNAETILNTVAQFIRRAPEQWAMYYPVWPEVIDQLPS